MSQSQQIEIDNILYTLNDEDKTASVDGVNSEIIEINIQRSVTHESTD